MIVFLIMLFSCQQSTPPSTVSPEKDMSASSEESTSQVQIKEEISLPGVILRDDARIWDNINGNLSDQSLASLDMGESLIYLGVDEDLKSGDNIYRYSKVQLQDGTVGWVSTVRLAKNAVPGVIVETTHAYSKPMITAPVNRYIPAGQIVAISLEEGKENSFSRISFCYYEKDRISAPESFFVKYNNLSSSPEDLDAAKLVLKAFRTPDQSHDFFKLALSLGSVFETTGTFNQDPLVFIDPDLNAPKVTTDPMIKLLAVNPIKKGEALPWYVGQLGNSELVWVYSSSVELPDLQEAITQKPELKDFSAYHGDGKESVNLRQGLALRQKGTDSSGKTELNPDGYLEMGQTVYTDGEEMEFQDINFIHYDLPNGRDEGWSSSSFIAVDTRPAVVTQGEIPVFSEPKLTALTKLKLQKYQIVAVSNETNGDFVKISYISLEDDTLQKDCYIRNTTSAFSFKNEDVNTAILFHKFLTAEDEELKEFYLKQAVSLPSFMRDDIRNHYFS